MNTNQRVYLEILWHSILNLECLYYRSEAANQYIIISLSDYINLKLLIICLQDKFRDNQKINILKKHVSDFPTRA